MTGLDLAREYASLDAQQTREVTTGRACPVHHGPMPCDACDRFLPFVVSGRVVTFDLASLTAEERRGARALAALLAAAIDQRAATAAGTAGGGQPNASDLPEIDDV